MRMKVFYLDSFLVLNLVLDYLLLLLTAKISGIWVQRYKLWLGAVFGAVFATGMFFFSGSGFAGFLLSVAAVWVMISLIFRNQSRIKRLRLAGIFFLLNLVFSGMMILLQNVGVGRISVQNGIPYIQMEFWQILASATGGFLLVRLCFRDHSAPIEQHRVHFHGELGQRKLDTLLLADSGNLLREPISGKPVILLAPEQAALLLPMKMSEMLCRPNWEADEVMRMLLEEKITSRLISVQTATEKHSLTIAVKLDNITINDEKGEGKTEEYWMGIARNDIDVCGGCRGVIGI